MTNERILEIAMGQSAIDANCQPGDFCTSENKIVISADHASARKYLELPFYCDLVSYGNNIVASGNEDLFYGRILSAGFKCPESNGLRL